ncbi:hypothetical protein K492DRAFT_221074 [Lichtheimia hyalospora FSU 10163]|nr:hypothetical protein K492DRAFT_221074 [Lichtheimia hyalospora FSU 10163]
MIAMATRVMQPARPTTTTPGSSRDPWFDIDTMNPYRLSGSSTLALAEFLASTGPEEFTNRAAVLHPPPNDEYYGKKHSSLFRKFRSSKRQASSSSSNPPPISSLSDIVVDHYHHRAPKAATRSSSGQRLAPPTPASTLAGVKHIPLLPASYEPMLRDSGVYSVNSSHGTSSSEHPKVDNMQQCTSTTSTSATSAIQDDLQLFPMPPPSVPSPRMSTISSKQQKRHSIFKATNTATRKNDTCPHCRQHMTMDVERKRRRSSCPPALAGGFMDGNKLLERIAQLEAMLMKERLSRKQLEDLVKQHLQQQQHDSTT